MVGGSPTGDGRPDRALLTAALDVELGSELLELALTHRSFAYEHGGLPTNERLEFLGDSVLGVVITDQLYRAHPDLPEGQLAKLRASIVNMHALAGVGRTIGVGDMLRLGHGEELTGGRDKASIVADSVEALIGAIYIQHGIDVARRVILGAFAELLDIAPRLGAGLDWKTSLQELAAAGGLGVPEYLIAEDGPDHDKTFTADVVVGGEIRGNGSGHTKKEAEQQAAATAYRVLQAGDGDGSARNTAEGAPGGPTGASGVTAGGVTANGAAVGGVAAGGVAAGAARRDEVEVPAAPADGVSADGAVGSVNLGA